MSTNDHSQNSSYGSMINNMDEVESQRPLTSLIALSHAAFLSTLIVIPSTPFKPFLLCLFLIPTLLSPIIPIGRHSHFFAALAALSSSVLFFLGLAYNLVYLLPFAFVLLGITAATSHVLVINLMKSDASPGVAIQIAYIETMIILASISFPLIATYLNAQFSGLPYLILVIPFSHLCYTNFPPSEPVIEESPLLPGSFHPEPPQSIFSLLRHPWIICTSLVVCCAMASQSIVYILLPSLTKSAEAATWRLASIIFINALSEYFTPTVLTPLVGNRLPVLMSLVLLMLSYSLLATEYTQLAISCISVASPMGLVQSVPEMIQTTDVEPLTISRYLLVVFCVGEMVGYVFAAFHHQDVNQIVDSWKRVLFTVTLSYACIYIMGTLFKYIASDYDFSTPRNEMTSIKPDEVAVPISYGTTNCDTSPPSNQMSSINADEAGFRVINSASSSDPSSKSNRPRAGKQSKAEMLQSHIPSIKADKDEVLEY